MLVFLSIAPPKSMHVDSPPSHGTFSWLNSPARVNWSLLIKTQILRAGAPNLGSVMVLPFVTPAGVSTTPPFTQSYPSSISHSAWMQ
ncbi:hypothetical protein QCA50_010879 [Cerrena zonata]|uniref:Uncharacterized protein n=1 Tax=Cerrena zonata TaxID=2478898 RepID=A0AAW0G8B9_9APHY